MTRWRLLALAGLLVMGLIGVPRPAEAQIFGGKIVFDPSVFEQVLQQARQGLQQLQQLRRDGQTSHSDMARDLAGTLMGLAKETFSGMYTHATKETAWLAVKAYADLVCGSSFRAGELTGGRLTVFLQLPLDTLKETPAIARVIVGALLNAAYLARGQVSGRVLFLLDEAARLGAMDILEVAREASRKYRITLLPIYQSEGQLIELWGQHAPEEVVRERLLARLCRGRRCRDRARYQCQLRRLRRPDRLRGAEPRLILRRVRLQLPRPEQQSLRARAAADQAGRADPRHARR